MRLNKCLLIAAAAIAASLGTAGWIASGDAPGRVTGHSAPAGAASKAVRQSMHPRTHSDAVAGSADMAPWWKDGAGGITGEPDIDEAASAAEILVLGLSEPRGIGAPVWGDWTPGAWGGVGGVPLVSVGGGVVFPPIRPVQIGYFPVPQWAVPEPASWCLLLFGFGAVGLNLRRRGC